MLTVVLIAVVAYLLSKITVRTTSGDGLDPLILETHKYSGIHEDSYNLFYANVRMAREYRDPSFMREALWHLNEIPLYSDYEVQEDLARLSQLMSEAFDRTNLKEKLV